MNVWLRLPALFSYERQRFLQHTAQTEVGDLELHTAGLDPRDVEYIVDEAQQVPAGAEDVLQVLLLLQVDVAEHPIEQNLGEADHGVQRCPQLVRHVSEELRLVPTRDLEFPILVIDRLKQLGARDRDCCLGGKRGDELDLSFFEHMDVLPPEDDHPGRDAIADHRHTEERPVIAEPLPLGKRVIAVG